MPTKCAVITSQYHTLLSSQPSPFTTPPSLFHILNIKQAWYWLTESPFIMYSELMKEKKIHRYRTLRPKRRTKAEVQKDFWNNWKKTPCFILFGIHERPQQWTITESILLHYILFSGVWRVHEIMHAVSKTKSSTSELIVDQRIITCTKT